MLAMPPAPLVHELQGPVRHQFRRTQLCKVFLQYGVCRDDCSFAHSENELKVMPDLQKTKLCPARPSACVNAHCPFAHGIAELRATAPIYKTQLCNWYADSGKCTRGARCRHAHGLGELRPVEPVRASAGKPVYAI